MQVPSGTEGQRAPFWRKVPKETGTGKSPIVCDCAERGVGSGGGWSGAETVGQVRGKAERKATPPANQLAREPPHGSDTRACRL